MTRDTHNDRRVVLVDFCGTVVDFHTSVEFTRFVAQRMPTPHSRRVERAIALSHRLRVTGVLRHLLPRASVVKRMNAYKLRGYSRGQLEALALRFYRERVRPRLVPPVMERIAAWRREGCRVWVVSGAYDLYIRHFVEEYGLDGFIATRLAYDGDVCTGKFLGPDCMGREKVRAVKARLGTDVDVVAALSDSRDDLPLLRLAAHPVVVSHGAPQAWATAAGFEQIIT